jgi:type IX secretion system PorP/SprF family membrane protein
MIREMKRIVTLAFFAMLVMNEVKCQDPEFTQFYANPMYTNPAFAGTSQGARFALNYRRQWASVSGAFSTYSASWDQHFDGIGGGIGGQVWYDRAGDGRLSTTAANFVYSYDLKVVDNSKDDYFIVKPALQAGFFNRSIDFAKLNFGDQIDPKRGFVNPTQEQLPSTGVERTPYTPDFSAGLLAFTSKYYFGAAVHHIIEPSQSFFQNPRSTLPRRYTVNAGMTLPLDKWKRNPTTFISPNLLFMRQAQFTQVNFGAYLIKNAFVAGLWFRQTRPNSDALMALIGVKKDGIKIGYSYDLTVSDARSAAVGSHEVSLIIELPKTNSKQTRKWRKINCPDF